MNKWVDTSEWLALGRWYDSRNSSEKRWHETDLARMGLGKRTAGGLFHLSELGREILHFLLSVRV